MDKDNPIRKKVSHWNFKRNRHQANDSLKARWIRFKRIFRARRQRVSARLSKLGNPLKKLTGALGKRLAPVVKAFAPAARFAERVGLKALGVFALKTAASFAIGALAFTPLGWSVASVAIGIGAAIGATMLVDFAFDAVGKRFGGKAGSLPEAVKLTAREWWDVARKNIGDFKDHIFQRDVKAVRSDLVRFSYTAADEYSGHLLNASDGSFKSAAKWFIGSNLGMIRARTTVAFTLAAKAIAHPHEAYQIAKELTSGFKQIVSLSTNATEAVLKNPDMRQGAEIAVGVMAGIKTAEYGMHLAASPVRGAGSFGRAVIYGGAMLGITYAALKHPQEAFQILGKAGHAADVVTETVWNHPDLRDLVITGGVAGAAKYVSNRRPVERLQRRFELAIPTHQ